MITLSDPIADLAHHLTHGDDLVDIMDRFVQDVGLRPGFLPSCVPYHRRDLAAALERTSNAMLGSPARLRSRGFWRTGDGRLVHGIFDFGPRVGFFFYLPELGRGLVTLRDDGLEGLYLRFTLVLPNRAVSLPN